MKNDIPELWRQRAKAGLCPVCGKTPAEFEPRMRVYCSPKCRDKYASKFTYWSTERDKFLKEHGKVCDICGITPEEIRKKQKEQYSKLVNDWLSKPENRKQLEHKRDDALVNLSKWFEERYNNIMDDIWLFNNEFWDEKRKIQRKIPDYGPFAVDHIKALCNGGDMWDKSNWQVLCSECHKNKTKEDLKEYKLRQQHYLNI